MIENGSRVIIKVKRETHSEIILGWVVGLVEGLNGAWETMIVKNAETGKLTQWPIESGRWHTVERHSE